MATVMFDNFVKELKKLNPSVEIIVSDAMNECITSSVAPYKLFLPKDYYWYHANEKCAFINKKDNNGNAPLAYSVVLVEKTQNQTQALKKTISPMVEPSREM